MSRVQQVTELQFKVLLANDKIRAASLDDVEGTHHQRPLYRHPRTGQWFVEKKEATKS